MPYTMKRMDNNEIHAFKNEKNKGIPGPRKSSSLRSQFKLICSLSISKLQQLHTYDYSFAFFIS